VEGHTADSEEEVDVGSLLQRAVGDCPLTKVKLGSVDIWSLLDTGSQVSTVTESFFRKHLEGKVDITQSHNFIRISGANGLEVPYLGYIELDLEALGYTFPNLGFLVAKNPVGSKKFQE